jgi:hypothetical protein
VLIVVAVKVVVSQGDTTMTPLSWILIAKDVNASDIAPTFSIAFRGTSALI